MPLEVEKAIEQQKIAAYVVGHLPIIKSYAIKIGLVDIINELIPSKMDVDPGTIFLGMVIDSYDANEILKAYKDQYGIEQNFSFLKDPVIVNSIFLKSPQRIEVLGLVLLLSLLIWRLIERQMR